MTPQEWFTGEPPPEFTAIEAEKLTGVGRASIYLGEKACYFARTSSGQRKRPTLAAQELAVVAVFKRMTINGGFSAAECAVAAGCVVAQVWPSLKDGCDLAGSVAIASSSFAGAQMDPYRVTSEAEADGIPHAVKMIVYLDRVLCRLIMAAAEIKASPARQVISRVEMTNGRIERVSA